MKIQYFLIAMILVPCSLFSNEKKMIDIDSKESSILISGNSSKFETINSDSTRRVLYKGTLNGTIKISLYLNEQEHPCGGNSTILNAMYKYDNQEKWILLNVTADQQKQNFCMVEDNFTGVLFLEETNGSFSGNWISPNTSKQFQVELNSVINDSIIEKLDEILFDDLLYNKNDC